MPFPMTHTYATCELAGGEPLAIVGCTLPDIASLYGTLDERDTHNRGLEFLQYLRAEAPEYEQLGIGVLLHGETPAGLDHYAHVEYGGKTPGYAEARCKLLVDDVKALHGAELPMPDNDIAHTLIELGMELYVAKRHPLAAELLDFTLRNLTNADLYGIAGHASDFFGGEITRKNIVDFYGMLNPRNFSNLDVAVRTYPRLISRAIAGLSDKALGGRVPDGVAGIAARDLTPIVEKMLPGAQLRNVVINAMHIVAPDYKEFLETSVKKMDAEIRRLGIARAPRPRHSL